MCIDIMLRVYYTIQEYSVTAIGIKRVHVICMCIGIKLGYIIIMYIRGIFRYCNW